MGLFAFRRRRDRASGVTKASDVNPSAEKEIEDTEAEKALDDMTVPELKEKAKAASVEGYSEMKKAELIEALQQ